MKKHSMKIILSFPQHTRLNIKVEYAQKPSLKQKNWLLLVSFFKKTKYRR